MNTMTYKGYTARVEYDERDDIFVGRILGIRSIISFHGKTVAGLRAEFRKAVNDYIAECEAEGVKPEKPISGKLLLRVPPEVHGKALVRRRPPERASTSGPPKSCNAPYAPAVELSENCCRKPTPGT